MSVNKVILLGYVGKEPITKEFDNNNMIAMFSLATSEKGYTTKSGVQVPERTDWHNVVFSYGLAKVVQQYVKKGSQVYVEGKIRTRSYQNQKGETVYITEVVGTGLTLLGGKPGQQSAPQETQPQQAPDFSSTTDDEGDGLPF